MLIASGSLVACGLSGCAAIVGFPDRTEDSSPAEANESGAGAPDDAPSTGDPGQGAPPDAPMPSSDGGDAAVDAAPTFCSRHPATFCDDFESAPLDASWALHDNTLKGTIGIAADPHVPGNHVLQLSVLADSTGTVGSGIANALYVSHPLPEGGVPAQVTFQANLAVQDPSSDAGQVAMEISDFYNEYVRVRLAGASVDFAAYWNDAGQDFVYPSPWYDDGGFHSVSVTIKSGMPETLVVALDGNALFSAALTPAYFDLTYPISWRLGNTSLQDDGGAQQLLYDNVLFTSP